MTTTDDHAAGRPADESGTFDIGGALPVNRLGYGTMRLTGEGVWGEPADRAGAVRVLRRAVELGVNLIDTADSYGPQISEQLIKEALYPYPEGLVIATKAGLTRRGPDDWRPLGRPEYLRQQLELSLRHLGVERIDLFQLHRVDPQVPLADQVGELAAMRDEGKIGHTGLSKVTVEQVTEARAIVPIASVQNRYSLLDRASEDVLDYCAAEGTGFIPYAPVATGDLARPGGPLDEAAEQHGATPSQLALAWLLRRSPVILPIPGTPKTAHVEENNEAARIRLSDADFDALSALATTA
ncbi:aldo/keto reductase [Nocardiopsis xinjiangensis]|uniref:aldo/keto reductase n=1 Tax=Nocardiopsis xinjiangensis TaxID=124285 RepID=UPI00034CDBC9|nr:aldo/keto reductase [Nocardiopsis xinjiangensis]